MATQMLSAVTVTTLLIIGSLFIMRRLRMSQSLHNVKKPNDLDFTGGLPEPTRLSKRLRSELPDSVVYPDDAASFKQSMNSYWAQQECEVIPACVVRPNDVQQLCTAVTILKPEYDEVRTQPGDEKAEGLFAIRSGGHSPVAGAASIKGGVLIDLSLFRGVTVAEDRSSVAIGAGAKWMDVSTILDGKGLAVIGGRNSAVGVGGLTLGGKPSALFSYLSFFPSLITCPCNN